MPVEYDQKHVVINRETMQFVGSAESVEAASIIANLANPADSIVIFPLDLKSRFSKFGILELILLHKNTTGEETVPGAIHDFGGMVAKCYELATKVPLDARSLFDLQKEAAKIPVPPTVPTRPAPIIQRMTTEEVGSYVPPAPVPKGPKAPVVAGAKPAGGSTKKVWDIADRVVAETGLVVGSKELRSKIIAACEKEGVNAGTAATQYGKWKATKT